MLDSVGLEKAKRYRKRSSTVLTEWLHTVEKRIKVGLLDEIRKPSFFGILLPNEVTDISNISIFETT